MGVQFRFRALDGSRPDLTEIYSPPKGGPGSTLREGPLRPTVALDTALVWHILQPPLSARKRGFRHRVDVQTSVRAADC